MSGAALPDDPEGVPSNTVVYRRINPDWYISVADGGHRLTSQAFQDRGQAMSVALGVVLDRCGLAPDVILKGFPGFGLVRLHVALLRNLGLGVVPDETEAEPWHGHVYGKKTGSIRNQLVAASEWVRKPLSLPQVRTT